MDKKQHNIVVFLDVDGYTAYYKEFPYISAGGETEVVMLDFNIHKNNDG